MNNQIAECQVCGEIAKKRSMRPIYTAQSSSMAPHILCYLCQKCYVNFLEDREITERYVGEHTKRKERGEC